MQDAKVRILGACSAQADEAGRLSASAAYIRHRVKDSRPCILVYNPISGHGHLDSWNAMFIAILIEKGWDVLALTPDVPALMSRLAQKGMGNSPGLHVLDHNASVNDNSWLALHIRLQQAWRWWNVFGDHYFYRRPGSETTPGMPPLAYWRTRLFQKVVPFLFRATHFLYARYRRCRKSDEISNVDADSEAGYLDPVEFATRIRAALKKSPWKPELVFNMYMDMYRSSAHSWNKFAALNRWPWVGIRFGPADLPQEGYYLLPSLRGMCFLDENICRVYQEKIPNKFFGYLPDITEAALPDQPSALAQEIRQRAAGRKIVFLGGSIGAQKNLARWYELIALADPHQWFFVQIGELHRGALTTEDTAALDKATSCLPENLLVKAEYLPDERAFNEIIATSDILFAVYREFRNSSNMLGKAAAFEKPILVADNYMMGERVRYYGIGKVAPQDDAGLIYRALMSMEGAAELKGNFERYRNDFGINAFEVSLTGFIERCVTKQIKASL
jgi:hypothetical protein